MEDLDTNSNQKCISLERIIDLVWGEGRQADMVHLMICDDCMSRFKGLQLSLKMEREKNLCITNEEFKQIRIEEIRLIKLLHGCEGIAVDMMIKCGLTFDQADRLFSGLVVENEE